MKKIIASLTAFICAASVFTGCGKIDDKDDKKDSGKQSEQALENDLEDAMQNVLDAVNEKDIKKIAYSFLPDDLSDSLFNIAADDINNLMDMEDIDLSNAANTGKLISVERTEDIDKNYLTLIEKVFSFAKTFADYMEKNDLSFEDFEEMDEDEMLNSPLGDIKDIFEDTDLNLSSPEDIVSSGILDKIETRYSITDGCMAEVTIEADGETQTIELPFYKIKGEGWHCEMILYPAMIGYVKKSKQSAINSVANSMSKAANTALVEMDEQGLDIDGTFIIGSDSNGDLNHNANSNFDIETFSNVMKNYFSDISDLNYFLVVNGGVCEYVVCKKTNDEDFSKFVGTYPIKSVPKSFNGSFFESKPATTDEEKLTFDELYDMTKKVIDNPSTSDDE